MLLIGFEGSGGGGGCLMGCFGLVASFVLARRMCWLGHDVGEIPLCLGGNSEAWET